MEVIMMSEPSPTSDQHSKESQKSAERSNIVTATFRKMTPKLQYDNRFVLFQVISILLWLHTHPESHIDEANVATIMISALLRICMIYKFILI